ncbi:MAG TPA: HlyD family efflux transporter periplasmic adaptor subunit, partial [Labilithrix sp.]|nr:HlyD family efflux transporter periplasmic adaptor subunit [Labilithrix sp.]
LASPLLDETARASAAAGLAASLSALGQSQAQEERATAARKLSEQELARTRALVASGAIARQAVEEAEFQDRMRAEELRSATFAVKVATEEVRRARALLGAREGSSAPRERTFDVRAPASGRVLRVLQKSAGVVQVGAPLIEVGDDSLLEVVVDLLTIDAVHVRVGTPVVVQGWDGGDRHLAGRVRLIEPSAFTRPSALGVDEQRVNVVIAFTDPREQWKELSDGYHVEVRFVLWRSDDVLKVPNGAVFRRGDRWAVYRVDGSRARLTNVTIGHRGEGEVEILTGLAPGDGVAVHPGDRVKDGVRVEARATAD